MHFLSAQIEPHCVASNAKAAFSDSYVVDYLETASLLNSSPLLLIAVLLITASQKWWLWRGTLPAGVLNAGKASRAGVQNWDQNSKF